MSLRPGYSWSATTYGTRDGSGVPVGAYESVPKHDCRYNQPPPAHRAPHAPLWRPNRSAAERSLVGTLTLSDLAPHHLEPEGQSAVMAGALSLDRSTGGVYGVMRSRSFCGVQRGERGC